MAKEVVKKLYVVTSVDHGGYDSLDVSYHLSRKGALKFIMNSNYYNWMVCRYISPGSYDELTMYITERELYD